jgi:ferritin
MESRTTRIIENAIEIADGKLPKLQEHFERSMSRESIIENYIAPWAEEAEQLWGELQSEGKEHDYYNFIDLFVEQKIKAL